MKLRSASTPAIRQSRCGLDGGSYLAARHNVRGNHFFRPFNGELGLTDALHGGEFRRQSLGFCGVQHTFPTHGGRNRSLPRYDGAVVEACSRSISRPHKPHWPSQNVNLVFCALWTGSRYAAHASQVETFPPRGYLRSPGVSVCFHKAIEASRGQRVDS